MKIRQNILIFKLNYFFSMCWPLSALAVVYFESITKSYALAMGIFSIATITQSFSEIPTGIISDRIGRRVSMILSALLILLAFFSFAFAGNYETYFLLVIGGIFWGISDSFMSGTDEALIYETMSELRKKHKYDIVFSQSRVFHQLGGAFSSVIAAIVLYFYSLNALAWISVLPALAQVITSLFFIEPSLNSTREKNSFEHLKTAWRYFSNNGKLKNIAIANSFNKAVSMTSYRLESVYFSNLIADWLVNIVILIRQLLGAISYAISSFFRRFGFFKMLVLSILGNVIIRAMGLIINSILSPFIMVIQNLFIGTATTSESALLQKEFSDAQRATMGSFISLLSGIVMAISYYFFGLIADIFSVYIAIFLLIFFKFLIGLYYYLILKKYK